MAAFVCQHQAKIPDGFPHVLLLMSHLMMLLPDIPGEGTLVGSWKIQAEKPLLPSCSHGLCRAFLISSKTLLRETQLISPNFCQSFQVEGFGDCSVLKACAEQARRWESDP